MTSVAVGDLAPCPLTTVDVRGSNRWSRRCRPGNGWSGSAARSASRYGSIASTCKAPRTGAEVKKWGIHGTTTKAIAIGAAVREAQRRHEDPIAAILDGRAGQGALQGQGGRRRTPRHRRLLARRAPGSTAWTSGAAPAWSSTSRTNGSWPGSTSKPIAMSPDLICVLDAVSGEAVGTETIRYGQRVTVIALPPPPVLPVAKGPADMSARAPSATTSTSEQRECCVSLRDTLARRHRIAGRRRLDARHRRRRQSLSAAAEHARASIARAIACS